MTFIEKLSIAAERPPFNTDRFLSPILDALIALRVRAWHLTAFRFAITPLIIYLVYRLMQTHAIGGIETLILLGLFILGALSDYFDGPLARRMGEVSHMGAMLDPIADKLQNIPVTILYGYLYAPVLATLVVTGNVIAFMVRHIFRSRPHDDIRANLFGKQKMYFEVVALTIFLLGAHEAAWHFLLLSLLLGGASLAIKFFLLTRRYPS